MPKKYLNSLLADYYDGRTRIILFATKKSKAELAQVRHFYCDGTFKCAPKPFLQIYSFHGKIDSVVKPLAYALLPDKKKTTYLILFRLLKSTVPDIDIKMFTSDFEEAAVRAIQIVFPEVEVKGCYFHFKQALKKKGKTLGLQKGRILRKHVALCTILPHLPPEALDDAWLYIMSESPQHEQVTKFNDYMTKQWIDHKLWRNKWCCYGMTQKTNNYCESHYATLSKAINKNTPVSLPRLFEFFQNSCDNLGDIKKKMSKSKCQQDAMQNNQVINGIIEEYKTKQISIGHCMEKLRF